MSPATEPRAGEHLVQFYESDEDLVAGAGRFLADPSGAAAVVIATEPHRAALAQRLDAPVLLDAAETLAQLTIAGRLDRSAFQDVVGSVVREAAGTGRPVRAFGEMVALLWEAGDVSGAIELESLWNELAAEVPFSLYCAYPSHSVRGGGHAAALERVCHLHTAVVPVEETWHFPAEPSSPGAARRRAAAMLHRRGHADALVDAVRLVISELAANAVRHAGSPFSVSVRDGATIQVRVRDASPVMPTVRDPSPATPGGRGLRLVAMVARRWRAEPVAGGKIVWAEL